MYKNAGKKILENAECIKTRVKVEKTASEQ